MIRRKRRVEGENVVEGNTPVENLLEVTIGRLKAMVDTSVVVGDESEVQGVTLIPISKVSVGFASGGGEYSKTDTEEKNVPFAGGSGAGYSVSPVGFIVVKDGDVKLLKVAPSELVGKVLDVVPEVIEAINEKLKK